ncbi:MAG: hypothetical protein AMXMBFR7_19180 [Planctomycetota bacterium]
MSAPLPSEPGATGNPVFDFRAGFRRSAGTLQRVLLWLGLGLALGGGAGAALGCAVCGWAALGGLGLLAAGIAWGFWWRSSMRAGFQETYRAFDRREP